VAVCKYVNLIAIFFTATTTFLRLCRHTEYRLQTQHRQRRLRQSQRQSVRITRITAITKTISHRYRHTGTRGWACGYRNRRRRGNTATERPAAAAITEIIIGTITKYRSNQIIILSSHTGKLGWTTQTNRTARTRNLWSWRITTTTIDTLQRMPEDLGRSKGRL